MGKEIKISLPFYKIAYSLFFIVILSIVRGISYTSEIGIALEAPMAILAVAVCADTYAQEIISKRSEIWRLYPMKKRSRSLMKRMLVQEIFLIFLAMAGYGLFYVFQSPKARMVEQKIAEKEGIQFLTYLAAMLVTLWFWGILSNTVACLFRNMWAGMGGCLILWILTNSSAGEKYLGSWNLFSYTFRKIEDSGSFDWLCGKAVCICLGVIMMALLPKILEKRG